MKKRPTSSLFMENGSPRGESAHFFRFLPSSSLSLFHPIAQYWGRRYRPCAVWWGLKRVSSWDPVSTWWLLPASLLAWSSCYTQVQSESSPKHSWFLYVLCTSSQTSLSLFISSFFPLTHTQTYTNELGNSCRGSCSPFALTHEVLWTNSPHPNAEKHTQFGSFFFLPFLP